MEAGSAISTLSSVITSTIKVAEKVFEIYAVDDQAKAVLHTVSQVSGQLDNARTLRRQKSSLLSAMEKQMFDDTIQHTESAIREVAALAERARCDMDVSGGKVRVNTRLLFVLRDSPNIHVSLTRLSISNTNLNSALMTLSNREGRSPTLPSGGDEGTRPASQSFLKPPPTYEESQFLNEGRQRNAQRRASAISLRHSKSMASLSSRVSMVSLDEEVEKMPSISIRSLREEAVSQMPPLSPVSIESFPEAVVKTPSVSIRPLQDDEEKMLADETDPDVSLPCVVSLEAPFDPFAGCIPPSLQIRKPDRSSVQPPSSLQIGKPDTYSTQTRRIERGRARSQRWLESRCQ